MQDTTTTIDRPGSTSSNAGITYQNVSDGYFEQRTLQRHAGGAYSFARTTMGSWGGFKGHSSLSIALHVDTAEGTVKNHRKSLYRKLGISSQSELFHLFVNQLLQDRP